MESERSVSQLMSCSVILLYVTEWLCVLLNLIGMTRRFPLLEHNISTARALEAESNDSTEMKDDEDEEGSDSEESSDDSGEWNGKIYGEMTSSDDEGETSNNGGGDDDGDDKDKKDDDNEKDNGEDEDDEEEDEDEDDDDDSSDDDSDGDCKIYGEQISDDEEAYFFGDAKENGDNGSGKNEESG